MQCPYCQTENREDRESCYVCGKDISTIRLVVNKARQHYNDALEHAERGRVTEALEELKNAIDLDWSLINAHVVMGTLYAREERFEEARQAWRNALALQPELERAHEYLERTDSVEVALPTLRMYRWIASGMFIVAAVLAATLIFVSRPRAGLQALQDANSLMAERKLGEAEEKLAFARTTAEPGGLVASAAAALEYAIKLDTQQQIRLIQDLKYRQMYPEALEAIAELETQSPDNETQAVLVSIRDDITYYYHNLISQLYSSYTAGDLDFDTLRDEIDRFIRQYPSLPQSDEIRAYLDRAERMEVQVGMDELRRKFALDYNVETAVSGLRDLTEKMGEMPSFQQQRQAFVEEILGSLFNMLTGYLDQEDFVRASRLLKDIQRVTQEFRDVIEVDISGAVDLAWSVLRDARRQYVLRQIDKLINQNQMGAAEEGIWLMLQEDELSTAEKAALEKYWRRVNRDDSRVKLYKEINDKDFFSLKMPDHQASETLNLLEDYKNSRLNKKERLYLLGLSTAAALKLGVDDTATSLAAEMRRLDAQSTVTRAIDHLTRDHIDQKIHDKLGLKNDSKQDSPEVVLRGKTVSISESGSSMNQDAEEPSTSTPNALGRTGRDRDYLYIAETSKGFCGTRTNLTWMTKGRFLLSGEPKTGVEPFATYTSPITTCRFPALQFLPSWNVKVSGQVGFRIELRVMNDADQFSPWFFLGEGGAWQKFPNEVIRDENWGEVRIDYLQLHKPAAAFQYRVQLYSFGADENNAPAELHRFMLQYSGLAQRVGRSRRDPEPMDVQVSVPYRSQLDVEPEELKHIVCCPTCVAMVLESYGENRPTIDICKAVYDERHKVYGVWPRASQAAFECGFKAWVQRFRHMNGVRALLMSGRPIIASIRVQEGELRGARYPKSTGHLIVIRGLTENGKVIVNDPYSAGPGGKEILYEQDDIERVWLDCGGVGIIIEPNSRTPY